MDLERRGLNSSNQHGFVRGRSCHTYLFQLFVEVTRKVDQGRAVDVVHVERLYMVGCSGWWKPRRAGKLDTQLV